MKQRGAVEAIGLLLRDRRLRERFAAERKIVLEELKVVPEEWNCLLHLSLEQLGNQAESLIGKRQGAVAKLLPVTWRRLGCRAQQQYRDYVDSADWPPTHQRHLLDAEWFCCFLAEHRVEAYSRDEHHWVSFLLSRRRFSIQLLRTPDRQSHQRFVVQCCFRGRRLPFKKTISLFRFKSR
ncbi:MAG: hypothetical protein CBB71_17985 [Rhodopirellula sp. TMED11]|nr:MAG: hypothetical protein CBB71_17985 [Rhodopirellula sp. TMED11]